MSLSILGKRISSNELRASNAAAVQAVSSVVKSTLGPCGYEKMIVDDMGETTVTSDGATILKQLEIDHPAGRMLADLSMQQDREVGDGTTTVVLLAAELINRGYTLISGGVHPTTVISGYRAAAKECRKQIKISLSHSLEVDHTNVLQAMARSALASKAIGIYLPKFADMLVAAVKRVARVDSIGNMKYPVKSVLVHKLIGGSLGESLIYDDYLLAANKSDAQMPDNLVNVKIAFLDFALKQHRMQLGVSVDVNDPMELENIRKREKEITLNRVRSIMDTGANVILSTQGMDDLVLKYIANRNGVGIRRVPLSDLKRLCSVCGGKVIKTLATEESEEAFDSNWLGSCESIQESIICDRYFTIFYNPSVKKPACILLRGPNEYVVDETERSVHDALCVISKSLEQQRVSPGGGCVEAALSLHLEKFSKTMASGKQNAVLAFSQSLEVLPKIIASNADLDANESLALLRSSLSKGVDTWHSLDLTKCGVIDAYSNGILEPTSVKDKAIQMAVEAAITILRIDDMITLDREPQPEDE